MKQLYRQTDKQSFSDEESGSAILDRTEKMGL
jgi:hypothetical protein